MSRGHTVQRTTRGGHAHSWRPLRRTCPFFAARTGHMGTMSARQVRNWACPAADADSVTAQPRIQPRARAPVYPVRRPRRAIKLFRARLAGTSASPGHVAAVRHRNPAPVVGSAVQSDQPAVGGHVCLRPVYRRPTPPDCPVVQRRARLRPPGGSGDLPGVAGPAVRHLLRTPRAPDSPRCILRRTNGTRASRGSPPPSERHSRPRWPRPSASCRWKCTSSESKPAERPGHLIGSTKKVPRLVFTCRGTCPLLLLDLNQQPFD